MKKNRALFALAFGCLSFALASCGSGQTPEDPSSGENPSSNDPAGDSSSNPETISGYRRVTSLDQIEDGAQVAIAGYAGSDLYGFTSQNKPNEKDGGVYSWYFLGEKIETVNQDNDVQDLKATALWTVEKSKDAFTFSVDGKYLSGYVDGSHYSIGLVDAPSASTTSWTLEMASNGAVSMKSAAGTYLEYYRSSWCGYSKSAEVYLYVPGTIALDPTPVNPDSSSQDPSLPTTGDDSGWEGINFAAYGNDFRLALRSRISSYRTKTPNYSSCLDIGAQAAAYPQGSNQFVPFYHAAPGTTSGVTGNGAMTTTKGACNREHTWPNSRGSGKSGPGADPFIIRPTLTSENSSRGNSFYGTGSSEWDPASCGFEGARGEAARIILYTATAYSGFELSNNPSDSASLHTMGTLKTLLEWNAAYPVTAIEKQINDYLCKQGYGRNPFVDHPEYANYIWDYSGLRSSSFTPAPSNPTNSSSSSPSTPEEPAVSSSAPTNKPAAGTRVDLFAACSDWAQYTKPTSLPENNGVSVTFFAGNSNCSYYDGQVHCYPNGGFKVSSLWPLSEVKLAYASNPNKNNTLVTGWTLSSDSLSTSLSVEEGDHEETVSLSNAFDFSLSVRGNAGNIGVSGLEVVIA